MFNSTERALQVLRLVDCNIHEEEYNHVTRSWWKIVRDGSVRYGFEVVSSILHGQHGVAKVVPRKDYAVLGVLFKIRKGLPEAMLCSTYRRESSDTFIAPNRG